MQKSIIASAKTSEKNRKNFIMQNDGFKCNNCGKDNKPLKGGCRNHCMHCLYSLHVDKNIPGDRESNCLGLMHPIEVDKDGKKGFIIVHECTKCRKIIRNKAAKDDDFDKLIMLSTHKML